MWSQWRAAVFLSYLLQMCSAVVVLDCQPTRNGDGMLYNILGLSDPLEAICDYLWNNGDIMLANNDDKTALATRHNSSTLETSECLADVTWKQECSQMPGGLKYFSANCSTTCANKNSLHGDSTTTKPTDEEKQSNTNSLTWIAIGLTIFGLTIFGLTIFLLYKYNCIPVSVPRIRHCSFIGRAYRAVRRENNELGTFNV